ncbi:MAG TPA: tetratricopeptide repeat protein [Chloroflexota bacterium]|nr:tetratricopeptide repeat protein [Chloroflexota bacterium]
MVVMEMPGLGGKSGERIVSVRAQPAPSVTVSPLRVRTLGDFAVWRGDERIPATAWSRRKVVALFTCLLGSPGYRLHRESVIEALWPEAGADAGANNLRVTVHRLRGVLNGQRAEPGYLRATGDVLALAPFGDHPPSPSAAEHWLDAAAFDRAATTALASRDLTVCGLARGLYTGDYLPDALYDDLIATRREELRQQYLTLLVLGARLSLDQEGARESEDWLAAVMARDRCHEWAARGLMRLYALDGRQREALQLYQTLARTIETELGQAPGARTRALAEAIREGRLGQESSLGETASSSSLSREATVTVASLPGNLPAPLNTMVGRVREVAEILTVFPRHRLVTLVGSGGVGKSRLALAAASSLAARYPDGAWLVEFASLAGSSEPGTPLLGQAVSTALGVREEATRPILATLVEYLATRRLLLVLDNCEHVIAAAANLAQALLRACPGLNILASSRERLEVEGEVGYLVPPLAVPTHPGPDRQSLAMEDIGAAESVILFLERARERRPGFVLTAENAHAVARICRQLEGLPLALELAAARLSVLPIAQIEARLDDCCRLLSGGPRTGSTRQQSLQGALDWSYGLLAEPEQAVFRRLAVFAGGCTLRAVEAVCAGDSVEAWTALDLVSGLVHKSLLTQVETEGEARYRLLEPVRQYALERLTEAGEEIGVRERHLTWCLDLAARAEPMLLGSEQAIWLTRLETEHDNLRAALTWCIQWRSSVAVQLAGPLWRFWWMRGHAGDGRRRLDAALACDGAPDAARATALNGAGALAYYQGDYERAQVLYESSLALRRELGDTRGVASTLGNLGVVADDQADYERAWALYEESLGLRRELEDQWGIAIMLNNLGNLARQRADYARALILLEESLALRRVLGDTWGISNALGNLGHVVYDLGDYPRAGFLQEESLALKRELGDTPGIANAISSLGHVARQLGDSARAQSLLTESLSLYRELGEQRGIAESMEGLAAGAFGHGAAERAVRLLGFTDMLRTTIKAPLHANERPAYERVLADARAALPGEAFAAAWAAGQGMSLEQAFAAAGDGSAG